jgi:hypothetical protein
MTAQAARPDAWPEHSSPNDLAEYAFFSSVMIIFSVKGREAIACDAMPRS